MRIILFKIFLLISTVCLSQDLKSFNLIIVVDERIAIANVMNIHILTNDGKKIDAMYYPGRLTLTKENVEELYNSNDSLTLAFDYFFDWKKQQTRNYFVPFGAFWFKQDFVVLDIYNLDRKNYKRIFDPLDKNRNYSVAFTYPGGQIIRLKRGRDSHK